MNNERPSWLKPTVLAHHALSGDLFVVMRLQQDRATREFWVSDQLAGEGLSEKHHYALRDCDRAEMTHFKTARNVWFKGKRIEMPRVAGYVLQEDGRLLIHPAYAAAIELAWAFDGEVVDIGQGIEI